MVMGKIKIEINQGARPCITRFGAGKRVMHYRKKSIGKNHPAQRSGITITSFMSFPVHGEAHHDGVLCGAVQVHSDL